MGAHTERAGPANATSGSEKGQLGGTTEAKNTERSSARQAIIIGKVRKNSRESIRVALDEFKNHRYVDIRVVVPGDAGDDRPTKAGITLRLGAIPELVGMLSRAYDEAKARGLISADEVKS